MIAWTHTCYVFPEYPVLTALTPDVIPYNGNVAVTLHGTYLYEDTVTHLNEVALNGVPIDLSTAVWESSTWTSVIVIMPQDVVSGGIQDVYDVTFSYNEQEFSNALPLTYVGELERCHSLVGIVFSSFCVCFQPCRRCRVCHLLLAVFMVGLPLLCMGRTSLLLGM